jgi:hypothetical protein
MDQQLLDLQLERKETLSLECGESVDCVEKFCYFRVCLAVEMEQGKRPSKASRMRVRCASNKFKGAVSLQY